MRFRGEHNQRSDAKCRVSIPAEFRRQLTSHGDARLVLVRSLHGGCAAVYPAQAWEAHEAKLLAMPQSQPAVKHVMRFQVASAVEVTPDGHGRVLLAQALRDYADIGPRSDVVVVGQGDRFELWNRGRWQAALAEAEAARAGEDFGEVLAELGL
jgi:MraZ protein